MQTTHTVKHEQTWNADRSEEMVAAARARGLDARVLPAERLEFAGEFEENYYFTPAEYGALLERHGFVVERIELIPRPTPLKTGMRAWLETFRAGLFARLPEGKRESVLRETVALLEPVLRDGAGSWTADYVRLRFKAVAG